MTSKLTKLALTAVLGLAITFTFNACGKGGGDVKLLESITDENGNVQKRFEYDKQNRIVKIDNDTITYADNLITVGTQKYVINGNTVTVDGSSFTIDKDGYFIKREGEDWALTLEYRDGNLIKRSYEGELPSVDVMDKYDDKKSPFFNCNSPKWLLYELRILDSYITFISKNNVLEMNTQGDNNITRVYKYEYDGDGFPTKLTEEATDEDNTTRTITRFTYRGETQTAPAQTETAASESQISGGEKCGKEDPPITIEAVFLENTEFEGMDNSSFQLPSGEQITFNGSVSDKDNVKKGDKVSVTYKVIEIYTAENDGGCTDINSMISLKKIGGSAIVKLLESISRDDDGNIGRKYKYDEQKRLVEMYRYHYFNNVTKQEVSTTTKITYSGNFIWVEEFHYDGSKGNSASFTINGNTVTVNGKSSFTINKDGYIVEEYKYKDGNIIKYEYSDEVHNFKYDDKKSPFTNSNTPKWLFQYLYDPTLYAKYASKNNVVEEAYNGENIGNETTASKYEYDDDGFPIKEIKGLCVDDGCKEIINQTTTRFIYR